MKRIISISVEHAQANAIQQLIQHTRARSASALIRQALHDYAEKHSPTLAHHFTKGRARRNTTFTGEGTPAHQRHTHPRFKQ